MTLRFDRRQFLMGSTALLGAAALSPAAALAQEKRMRLFFWGGQPRADRTYGVTSLYGAERADVAIDGEFLGWADYWPKLATQTAGGNAPDIIQMDYRYIVEYAKRGALAPLDGELGASLKLDDFDADQIEAGKVDGKLYGISLGTNSGATLVNLTALEEAGMTVDLMKMTYPDLKEAGIKFAEANIRDGMKLLSDGSGIELLLENFLRQRGKALYTADGKAAFEAADISDWFSLWADLRDSGAAVAADVQAADTGPAETSVLTLGKAATGFKTSNQLVAYQAINQDNLSMGIYPLVSADIKGSHYRKPSMYFSVGSSADVAEAASFINFFVNDAAAGEVLGVERGVPCSAAVRAALAPKLDAQSQVALNFVANLGDLSGALPPPPPPAAGEIEVALLTKSQEVAFGQQSPADAGPAFLELVEGVLSRAS